MLHHLRNDEIYPYFWRARENEAGEFNFLDLGRLQAKLRAKSMEDAELESLLYGQQGAPHLSGWTLARLGRTLQASGYGEPRNVSETNDFFTIAQAPQLAWGATERARARAWRREQKIWTWRKRLRSRAGGWKARAQALFKGDALKKLAGQEIWLNLGAGSEMYPAYIKVDCAGAQDVYDDITQLSKIRDGSVARIYCNHVLEHIPQPLIAPMLARWKQVLKPGGMVLARMPDARAAVLHLGGAWVEASDQELRQFDLPNFLEREPTRKGVLDEDSGIQCIYGWSNSTPHTWDAINQHKTLWTPGLARKRFEAAGFRVDCSQNLGTLNTLVVACE